MRKFVLAVSAVSMCLAATWATPAAADDQWDGTDVAAVGTGSASQWIERPPLGHARAGLGVATAGRHIFAIGGFNAAVEGVFNFVEARRVSGRGTWREMAPLPTARANLATAELGGLAYAIGGLADVDYDVVETFDPRTGRWSTGLPLPQPRGQAGAAALDGLLYVAGGGVVVSPDRFEITNSVIVYDPDANAWRSVAPMPTVRERLRLVASGGHLYAIGGRDADGQALSTVERYDPHSDRWHTMSSMSEARYLPCAVETRVGGRRVLVVVGGRVQVADGTVVSSRTTEVFDPDTRRWTLLDVLLPEGRASFDCAIERDGTVLAIGGSTNVGASFTYLADVDGLKIRQRDLR
jgi:N-acetylneuraminic acid mutarotase